MIFCTEFQLAIYKKSDNSGRNHFKFCSHRLKWSKLAHWIIIMTWSVQPKPHANAIAHWSYWPQVKAAD